MIIDTHAHLTDEAFKENVEEIINSFNEHNLQMVFTIGYDLQSSKNCITLAEKHNNVYAIIGFHPSDIDQLTPQNYEWLESVITHPKVLAIGEIGLDLHYESQKLPEQIEGFIMQMQLANKYNLPIVIHTRDANVQLLDVLKQNKHLLNNGGIVHCFSENYEFYKQIEGLGLIISLGGALTFKNAQPLREVVKQIPLTSIVLETDSPYLTPAPLRGQFPNQPKNTNFVAQQLSEIKQVSLQEVEKTTNNNVYKLFKKLWRGDILYKTDSSS